MSSASPLARNYAPLPITPVRAEGGLLHDAAGESYLDAISGYGVTNAGHAHPVMMAALRAQLETGVLATSRAVTIPGIEEWATHLSLLTGMGAVLPMTTGAEAVETAIKVMRKAAYLLRDVSETDGVIIYANGNFHGRTSTIVGMSSDPQYRGHFGPFAPGFVGVPFGDLAALEQVFQAHANQTIMFLVEPVQAEGGMIVAPDGYWSAVRQLCDTYGVPLVLDEIQTGFGRTGTNFAFQGYGIRPDGLVLGKYMGGGVPLSAFLTSSTMMNVIQPGDHGSTFGGNPLAIAGSRAALTVLHDEHLAEQAVHNGGLIRSFVAGLVARGNTYVTGIRGRGMMLGLELAADAPDGGELCRRLLARGVVTNTAHDVIRVTPRLNLSEGEMVRLQEGLTAGLLR